MTRRSLFLIGAIATGVAVWAVVHKLSSRPVSDEEAIRAMFVEAVKAAEEKRVGDAVTVLSERFRGEGTDKQGVKRMILAHVMRGTWVSLTISDMRIQVSGRR